MLLTSNNGVDSIVQLITVLVIFVFVLVITLLVTKWMAGFQKQQSMGKNIQVIETTRMTANQCVQILKIGNKYVAVAVGKDNVTLLAQLDEDEIDTEVYRSSEKTDFASVFNSVKNIATGKYAGDSRENKDDDSADKG